MEPVITVALLVGALHKVIDSAAGEAGPRIWGLLTDFLRRRRMNPEPSDENEVDVSQVAMPQSDSEVDALAHQLFRFASTDPDFAASLHSWMTKVDREVPSISNTISGTVNGNAVLARDINGPITFN